MVTSESEDDGEFKSDQSKKTWGTENEFSEDADDFIILDVGGDRFFVRKKTLGIKKKQKTRNNS